MVVPKEEKRRESQIKTSDVAASSRVWSARDPGQEARVQTCMHKSGHSHCPEEAPTLQPWPKMRVF